MADTVIAMVEYEPHDVTEEAREIAGANPTGRLEEGGKKFWGLSFTGPRSPKG